MVIVAGALSLPDRDRSAEDGRRAAAGAAPSEGRKTAKVFNEWIAQAASLLTNDHPANMLALCAASPGTAPPAVRGYLQGQSGVRRSVPDVPRRGQTCRDEGIRFEGDTPEDEFRAVAKFWNDFDFFFVHIKPTDSRGEDGDFAAKVKVIEEVDQALPALLALEPDVLLVTGDHSTPAVLKSHSWHPCPLLLWAPETVRADAETVSASASAPAAAWGLCRARS